MPAAAILARLWGALAREPIPGVRHRQARGDRLILTMTDGTVLEGDAATARPFASPAPGFEILVRGSHGERAVAEPGTLVRSVAGPLGRYAQRLATELDDSVANLALARSAQPTPDGGPPMLARAAEQPDPLAWLESSVVDGHPLHPGARTRLGLSPDEVRAYAPEHRPVVGLRRVTVPERAWYGVRHPPQLLLHPYQHDKLRAELPELSWLSAVDGEVPARPLLSLRTLATVADPRHHVKTAVDVLMTSAVRTVSPASVHNGLVLSQLVGELGLPGLDPIRELGGGAAIVDGAPDRRLGVAHRRLGAPAAGELDAPLAVLTAPSLATGRPIVHEVVATGYRGDPVAFLTALAGLVLRAVLAGLDRGVALEAHGQNLLGTFRGGTLVGLRYRDFGGVRVSARRLQGHGVQAPPLLGDVPCDDPEVLRTKAFASAVSTLLGSVVAALDLDEEKAWHHVAAVARPLPGPDVAHLFADTLPVKAMTAMRLADQTVEDLWCALPNPMAGLG